MFLKPQSSRLTRWLSGSARRLAKEKARRLEKQAERFAWNLQRVALHTRIGGKCQRCKIQVYLSHRNPFVVLNSHHKVFRSAGGSDELSNQCGLCGGCHNLIHRHIVDVEGTAEHPRFVTRHPELLPQ